MVDQVRILNEQGLTQFREFVIRARAGSAETPPTELLKDSSTSAPLLNDAFVEQRDFANRFEFGEYLHTVFKHLDRSQISRNHALWNWLALYYFDFICKPSADGSRKVLRPELYFLENKYNYLRYYKHLVRTPWLAVLEHGSNAKVLFITARGTRSDIEETLAASQQVIGNPILIGAAQRLYFDEKKKRPKSGASSKGAGSPRRFTAVIQQLSMTYDIPSCSIENFLGLLPKEFEGFLPTK